MSEAILQRLKDPSGVSGTGAVADIYEAPDGAVAIRWRGPRPSWGLWSDIRDLEAIHGHNGSSLVQYLEPHRLLSAYQRIMPFLLVGNWRQPLMVGPHPDHTDRLRLVFLDQPTWAFWVALLDGSTDTATHDEVDGEIHHTFITPDGDIWCQYFSPLQEDNQ